MRLFKTILRKIILLIQPKDKTQGCFSVRVPELPIWSSITFHGNHLSSIWFICRNGVVVFVGPGRRHLQIGQWRQARGVVDGLVFTVAIFLLLSLERSSFRTWRQDPLWGRFVNGLVEPGRDSFDQIRFGPSSVDVMRFRNFRLCAHETSTWINLSRRLEQSRSFCWRWRK